jgi:NAD(P)-dependent dehydrogenase (short-subunit alcohol dehydrogenase family)
MTESTAEGDVRSERVVIVTGGSRGIGASIVTDCVRDGWTVCFTFTQDEAGAREVMARAPRGRVLAVRADVTDEQAMERVFDDAASLGLVTALVNNAGSTGPIGEFAAVSIRDVRRVVEVNLVAPIIGSRIAAERWAIAPEGAAIVNVSSIAATSGAPGEYIPYAAAKAGVETLTIGLAKELGPRGIRVNAVSPGTTLTGIHALAGEPGRPARVAARIPLGRPAEPTEISAAVRWLLSPEASYVTGAVLRVAGGL